MQINMKNSAEYIKIGHHFGQDSGQLSSVPCLWSAALSVCALMHLSSTSMAPHSTMREELEGERRDMAARQAAPCSKRAESC